MAIANQMIIDSLSSLLSMSERLKDEARVESIVVWSLKILTVVSAAATTTLSALPGFDMGATIAGAVTIAFTTIQSVEPIGVNRGRKLVAARKLEMVMNTARLQWNERLLRLSSLDFEVNVERIAADVVEDLRHKTEEIAAYVQDLIVDEGNNDDKDDNNDDDDPLELEKLERGVGASRKPEPNPEPAAPPKKPGDDTEGERA